MPRYKLYSVVVVCVVVTMAASVLGNNRAQEVCGDKTGQNCLYKTNENEYRDFVVQFDKPLPSWLTGTLIRNGLGMFERGKQSVTHAFDGFAKLSSWKFLPNGTTFFSTRFVRSGFYKDTMSQDLLAPYMTFNPPDPPFNALQKATSILRGLDNMNINVFDFPKSNGGDPEFAVFSDYWKVYEVSGRDLSTGDLIKPKLQEPKKSSSSTRAKRSKKELFNKMIDKLKPSRLIEEARTKLGGGAKSLLYLDLISSGHPLPEPGTTNRLTFLVRQKTVKVMNNRLLLVRMSSVSGRSVIAEWKVKETIPYMHSFSVTQTKVVMVTGPLVTDTACLFDKAAPLPCMKWLDDKPSTIYIADLKTGKKKTITMASSIFAIHHINAYDVNDDEIIMDVVSYDTINIVQKMLLIDTVLDEQKRNSAYVPPVIRRIHVYLSRKTAQVTDMSLAPSNNVHDGLDMPAINEAYRSQTYCYAYGLNSLADGKRAAATAVIKKDMCDGGKVVGRLFVPNHIPVEPAFVPDPQGTAEDDGVLLVPMLRGENAVTYLAVVDAKTMTISSQADMPDYLPFSLHGRFFKDFY